MASVLILERLELNLYSRAKLIKKSNARLVYISLSYFKSDKTKKT